jgi:nucleotide-binding universal stress UspA family protein
MQGIAARTRENLSENAVIGTDEEKSRVEYAIREGKTAENIVDFAHAENIDLLVISTHGSGGLSRWNISSVTQKVINLIYLPVLIVRTYNQPELENTRIRYRRILLPIDSSRRAECALPAGIALARGESIGQESNPIPASPDQTPQAFASSPTKLILAAVIKPPELPIPEPYPGEIEQLANQLIVVSRYAVKNYLNEMKERLSVDCETCVLENISVSSAIQELANQEEDIDLVILCAHGYTGQSTWPYGSVARNYMEHGAKPVLVIQDVSRSQVRPSAAELAAEKSGRR